MGKRLITAGLCVLGLLGATAGSAAAYPGGHLDTSDLQPSKIQLFDTSGLVGTIDCTTQSATLECQSQWNGHHAVFTDLGRITGLTEQAPYTWNGGVRYLDPRGNWFGETYTSDAIGAAMYASGVSTMETDNAYLDSLVAQLGGTASASKHHGHAHVVVHAAKKKGHGKKKSHK